jgi:heme/copper-type cytochrome/quinol oxidase subunit 1
MTRAVAEVLLFFVVPFLGFAVWLLATRQPLMSKESWEGTGGWLAIAGLVVVIAAFIWLGATAERHTGAYEPSHLENGTIVPGRIR